MFDNLIEKNWKIDNSAKHQFSEEPIFRYLGAKDGLSQCSVLSPILFVFILSALFENLSCMKSDFSDDGDTGTQVYLNCQITLKPLEPWSKKWRIAVNGDKTSILYRNSEKTNALKIIGEACQIIKNTIILGLIVDNKQNFNEHLQQVEVKVAKHLLLNRKFCGTEWGVKQRRS